MTRVDPVRVLVVDDSAVVRRWLQAGLGAEEGIEVIGSVADAFAAQEAIFRLHPDVLTLDIELPRMDGLTFLAKLMRHHPMPVVVHSAVTPDNSPEALSALSLGAVAVVPKAQNAADLKDVLVRLAKSVRAGARSRPHQLRDPVAVSSTARRLAMSGSACTSIRAIGIAASTGGPQAIEAVLRPLPADFPCVLIVQHLPERFVGPFAERLDKLCELRVRVAKGGETLQPGEALIAPGDRHLSLGGIQPVTRLCEGPQVNFHRPSADVLFRGIARSLGSAAIGVILTGMGRDGASGLLEMHAAGAHTIAESEPSCVVYGMPRAAVESGAVTEVSDQDHIANRLACVLNGAATQAR